MSRVALILVGWLAASTCAAQTSVSFPTANADGTASPTVITATLYKPGGRGPFPAMVVLHHCGGIDAPLLAWAKRLAGAGYVSIVPDSFGPRGVLKVCSNGRLVTHVTRAGDAYAAADYLRRLPDVRGDRIGAIGFSHGGATVVQLASRPALAAAFRAAVAYYPGCSRGGASIALPTLVLIGEKDDWTPAADCTAWASRAANADKLAVAVYPDAYHAFDIELPTRWANGGASGRHRLQYDGSATVDSVAKADAFLARWLKP